MLRISRANIVTKCSANGPYCSFIMLGSWDGFPKLSKLCLNYHDQETERKHTDGTNAPGYYTMPYHYLGTPSQSAPFWVLNPSTKPLATKFKTGPPGSNPRGRQPCIQWNQPYPWPPCELSCVFLIGLSCPSLCTTQTCIPQHVEYSIHRPYYT